MRGWVVGAWVAVCVLVGTEPVRAQLSVGPQVAMISGLDEASGLNGDFGLGVRVGLEPPGMPVGAFLSGTYFFPSDEELSYYTLSLGGKLGIPLQLVYPYLVAGVQRRSRSVGGISDAENGAFLGLGVQIVKVFVEGSVEFNRDDPGVPDFDNDPIVFRVGFSIR